MNTLIKQQNGSHSRGRRLAAESPIPRTTRLCVLFWRLGPYHHARLRAAGRLGSVTALELTRLDTEYDWDEVQGAESFERRTLFPAENTVRMTVPEVRRRMFAALDELRPDVVAVPGWSFPDALAALTWCARSATPSIVMSESQAHDHRRAAWRELVKRRLVRMNAAGFVGGRRHIDYLMELGLPRERVFTGYDVVDNEHFASGADAARAQKEQCRQRLRLPRNYFLASNRFIEKKNLPGLLRAFANYRRRAGGAAWDLVMLGDGPERSHLERTCRDLDIQHHVQFSGFQQYDVLPAYYGLAQAFVHASTTEQWGLVVNEALSAGLPVIVSDRCGCAPELVRHGDNGYTFDPGDENELSRLLERVATAGDGRAVMGKRSREIVSDWSPDAFGDGIWRAVEAATQTSRRKATWVDQALLRAMRGRL